LLAASFESGSSARLATIAKITRSARPSKRRLSSSRASVRSTASSRHSPSSAHAPPIGRDSMNRNPGAAIVENASSGASARCSEPISLRIASRSS